MRYDPGHPSLVTRYDPDHPSLVTRYDPDHPSLVTDLASVAVVMIFLPLAGDQGRPAGPAGDDGLETPGTPGRQVPSE